MVYVEKEQSQIKVEFEEGLENLYPFKIQVNAPLISELLEVHGMDPLTISQKSLILRRNVGTSGSSNNELGSYDIDRGNIELYTDTFYLSHLFPEQWGTDLEGSLNCALAHEVQHALDFSHFYVRFIRQFCYPVLGAGLGLSTGGLVYQVCQAMQYSQQRSIDYAFMAAVATPAILGISNNFGLLRKFNPLEIRAKRFADKVIQNPRYRKMIEISHR